MKKASRAQGNNGIDSGNNGRLRPAFDFWRDLCRAHARLMQLLRISQMRFRRAELDIGVNMCNMALAHEHGASRNRMRGNARKAYDALQRYLPKVMVKPGESAEIETKMSELERKLQLLEKD